MKKFFVLLAVLSILFVAESITYGYDTTVDSLQFDGFGARADAMGGAFTAVADDGFAPYWNPAGITQLKIIALTTNVGMVFDSDLSFPYVWRMVGGLTTHNLAGNVFAKIYNGDYSKGILINQMRYDYTVTIATPLFGKWVAVGGNFKYITTTFKDGDECIDGVPVHNGERVGLTYDLGWLIKPADFVSIGFIGRDLKMIDEEGGSSGITINVYPSYAFGLALKPFRSTILAADLELLNDNRILHLGFEQTALWEAVALRAGMIKSLSNGNAPVKINVGTGLKIFGVYIDCTLLDIRNQESPSIEASAGFRY